MIKEVQRYYVKGEIRSRYKGGGGPLLKWLTVYDEKEYIKIEEKEKTKEEMLSYVMPKEGKEEEEWRWEYKRYIWESEV